MSFIKIDEAEAQKRINAAVLKKLETKIDTKSIKEKLQVFTEKAIKSSDTWNSLLSSEAGSLGADFGIRRGENAGRLDAILEIWLNSIQIQTKFVEKQRTFLAFLRVYGINASFSSTKNLPEAITINKGEKLPWLDWLVLRGSSSVITGFKVEYGNYQKSRSGHAVMTPTGQFSVQSKHSGTAKNNFITRALESAFLEKEMQELIFEQVKKALR